MDDPYVAAFIVASMFVTTVVCMAVGALLRAAMYRLKGGSNDESK